MRSTGNWPVPVQAPAFQASCAGGRTVTLADLRGQVLRLVVDFSPGSQAAPNGVITIIASADPAAHPGEGVCVTRDEDVPLAYAIIAGLTVSEVSAA